MKKIYTLILIANLIFSSAFADSYHTIVIDGINNGWTANETFTNISHDGATTQPYAYFTWDEDWIYIGISDTEADYDDITTYIYFDTDPTGDNGTTNAYTWNNYITTPFNADFVVALKNGLNNPNDYIEVRQFNGISWNQNFSNVGMFILDGTDTVVSFAVGTDYREFKISRSHIGNPEAIKTCMFTEQQWSPNWRYLVWPSNEWDDTNSTAGQAIPHYYGFILNDNIQQTDYPYFDCNITGFTGAAKSTNWDDAANWTNGIPDGNAIALIPTTMSVNASTGALCYDLSISSSSTLNINSTSTLSVNNNLYNQSGASGIYVESTSSGNGSLIVYGDTDADVTAQCYMTDGVWHSFAAPVSGLVSEDLYLDGSPEVWLGEYEESTKEYTFVADFDKPLGDMKGWMTWIETSTPKTYSFEGGMHSGLLGSENNMVRSQNGDYGYNYVGNPFTSAIDWYSSDGWYDKNNLNNAIYIMNNGSWATFVDGVETNGGSRYIAMNQGFFVQVFDGQSSGTLKFTSEVCTHNSVPFLKNNTSSPDSLIRLQLESYGKTDETVIRFIPDATEGYDGNYDAHKMFSHSDNKPLIYSTANNFMSINSLPPTILEIPLDVKGIHNANMTISATEINTVDDVYLKDNLTGEITDLSTNNYSFKYDNTITDRFIITSLITGINETTTNNIAFTAYSTNKTIHVSAKTTANNTVNIYNINGREIYSGMLKNEIAIPVNSSGCYIVTLSGNGITSVKKVIVK